MHQLITATAGSAWSYGASILTFLFPMILFVAVAAALYVLYTKPHLVPGHRYRMDGGSASVATGPVRAPGQGTTEQTAAPGTGEGSAGTGAEG